MDLSLSRARAPKQKQNKSTRTHLDDAAPAGRRPHRLQQDGVRVLAAATGEDDPAPPAAGRSRRDAVRGSVAAQSVSKSIPLGHDEGQIRGVGLNNNNNNKNDDDKLS